jgi:hypothetical protein
MTPGEAVWLGALVAYAVVATIGWVCGFPRRREKLLRASQPPYGRPFAAHPRYLVSPAVDVRYLYAGALRVLIFSEAVDRAHHIHVRRPLARIGATPEPHHKMTDHGRIPHADPPQHDSLPNENAAGGMPAAQT